jgi:hypothetical protein
VFSVFKLMRQSLIPSTSECCVAWKFAYYNRRFLFIRSRYFPCNSPPLFSRYTRLEQHVNERVGEFDAEHAESEETRVIAREEILCYSNCACKRGTGRKVLNARLALGKMCALIQCIRQKELALVLCVHIYTYCIFRAVALAFAYTLDVNEMLFARVKSFFGMTEYVKELHEMQILAHIIFLVDSKVIKKINLVQLMEKIAYNK